jgi:diguanylate cyclase (GGDEF)-like protein
MRQELSARDVGGRLGGDEFCMLIRAEGTETALERIRSRLIDHEFRSSTGRVFHAAITFGVARSCDSDGGAGELLRLADQSLYMAKDARRGVSLLNSQLEPEAHRVPG